MKNLYILFICLFSLSFGALQAQNTSDCICTAEYDPVCSTDGITYGNFCLAACENADIAYEGSCSEQSMAFPANVGAPFSYTHNLGLNSTATDGPFWAVGSSPDWTNTTIDTDWNANSLTGSFILSIEGTPAISDIGINLIVVNQINAWTNEVVSSQEYIIHVIDNTDCNCIMLYSPVCGVDGQTYGNSCEAECENVDIAYEGECEMTNPCLGEFEILEQEYIAGFAGMMLHLQVLNAGNDLSTTMASVILANTCASTDQFTFESWATGDVVDMYFNYSCLSMAPYIDPFEASLVISGTGNCAQDVPFVFDPQGTNNTEGCTSSDGIFYAEGSSWNMDDCTFCSCENGEIFCAVVDCAMPPCDDPIYIDGQCCPTCEEEIYGCTNPLAVNYNPEANIEDDSCILNPNEETCTYYGETLQLGETMTINGELCTCQTFIVNEWGFNGGAQMFCQPLTDTLGCTADNGEFYPIGTTIDGECETCMCAPSVAAVYPPEPPSWTCFEIADCGDCSEVDCAPGFYCENGECLPEIDLMGCTSDNGEIYPIGYAMEGECETCVCSPSMATSPLEGGEWMCIEIADCEDPQDCVCPMIYAPVCGSNGVSYGNSCEAECAGITEYYDGECLPTSFCNAIEVIAETMYTDNGQVQLNITVYNNSTNDINYPVFNIETDNNYVSIEDEFENAYWIGAGESTTNSYQITGGGNMAALVEATYYVSQLNQNAACSYPITFVYEPMWGSQYCYENGEAYAVGEILTGDDWCETCICTGSDATVFPPEQPIWVCEEIENCGEDPCNLIDCAPGYDCVNGDCILIEPQEYGCNDDMGNFYQFGETMEQECNTCTCTPGFNPNAEGFWMCTMMPCEEECAEGDLNYSLIMTFDEPDGGWFTLNIGDESITFSQSEEATSITYDFCAAPEVCIEIVTNQDLSSSNFSHQLSVNGLSIGINQTSYNCDPQTNYVLQMYDTYGDSWNGAELTITSSEGTLQGVYTLEVGEYQSEEIYLADGCYNIDVTAGAWPSEISWNFSESYYPSLYNGGAPFSGVFGVNSDCGTDVEYGCELEGELYEFGTTLDQGCNSCYCQAGFNPNANGIWSCTEMACGGCTDPEAVNYDEYADWDDDSCEYGTDTTPNWDYPNTGSNHTLVLAEEMLVDLDGADIQNGDWIGVFYPLNGEIVCAGYAVWEGSTTVIPAQGDDTTTEIQDGFNANQEFQWLVWDASANTTYSMDATYDANMPNQEQYTTNGISAILTLTAQPLIGEQQLQLVGGWNMFSTFMVAEIMDAEALFASFIEDVVIVKNNVGLAYLPEYNYNGIGDLLPGQGYQAKLNNANELNIEGDYLAPEDNPINLENGWNLIAYLRTEPADVIAVFEEVQELVIVKDNSGMAYLPEYGFNGIGNMVAGQAYQIKVLEAQQLQYLPNNEIYRLETTAIENNLIHYTKPLNTGSNMTLVLENEQLENVLSFGDELAVYSSNGKLVGAFVYENQTIAIPVYGNDEYSNEIDGLLKDETLTLKYWSTKKNEEITLIANWATSTGTFEQNSIQVASFSVSKNSAEFDFTINPNPAKYTADLNFELTNNSLINVQVFNLLGDLMYEPKTELLNRGLHTLNLKVDAYSTGTYLVKLQTNNSVCTKRLLVH